MPAVQIMHRPGLDGLLFSFIRCSMMRSTRPNKIYMLQTYGIATSEYRGIYLVLFFSKRRKRDAIP